MVELFHRTEKPEAIMANGFIGCVWSEIAEWPGVWLGASPEATFSGHGDWIVVVQADETMLNEFEVADPATAETYEMLFVPETLANRMARLRVVASPRSSL